MSSVRQEGCVGTGNKKNKGLKRSGGRKNKAGRLLSKLIWGSDDPLTAAAKIGEKRQQ